MYTKREQIPVARHEMPFARSLHTSRVLPFVEWTVLVWSVNVRMHVFNLSAVNSGGVVAYAVCFAVVLFVYIQLASFACFLCALIVIDLSCQSLNHSSHLQWWQQAQLSHSDRATPCVSWNLVNSCIAVRKIAFEKACSRWMTLNVLQGHPNCRGLIGYITLPISGL